MQKKKTPENPLTLAYPVKVGGQEIKTIEMRRPKVGDMLVAQKDRGSDAENELALFASLTGHSPDTLRELDMADYLKLQEIYRSFLS